MRITLQLWIYFQRSHSFTKFMKIFSSKTRTYKSVLIIVRRNAENLSIGINKTQNIMSCGYHTQKTRISGLKRNHRSIRKPLKRIRVNMKEKSHNAVAQKSHSCNRLERVSILSLSSKDSIKKINQLSQIMFKYQGILWNLKGYSE